MSDTTCVCGRKKDPQDTACSAICELNALRQRVSELEARQAGYDKLLEYAMDEESTVEYLAWAGPHEAQGVRSKLTVLRREALKAAGKESGE